MNAETLWLTTSPLRITDELFQASLKLEHGRTKGELWSKQKAKPVCDTWGKCPANDLSVLGIHRMSGQARICGDFIELYITTSTYTIGSYHKPDKSVTTKGELRAKVERQSSIVRSAKRAEKTVRRLVNTNRLKFMWTLTLAPPSEKNDKIWKCVEIEKQRDISNIKRLFRNFYLRLQRAVSGCKWLVVYELHDSKKTSEEKRGTWHIHFATDTFLPFERMCKLWKHGISRGDDFSKPKRGARDKSVRNPGAYISKYIGKNFDESNFHIKRYSRSRNMETPTVIGLERFFEMFPGLETLTETYHTEVIHEENGFTYYNHNVTYRR